MFKYVVPELEIRAPVPVYTLITLEVKAVSVNPVVPLPLALPSYIPESLAAVAYIHNSKVKLLFPKAKAGLLTRDK
jgi:hypothetical protein